VALTPVAAREALLPSMLSGPGARASIAAEIADGFRAYTIKVSDVTGVGGHALPGDRVDVVLMRDLTPEAPTRSFVSEVVIQDIRVLGVDLNADPTSAKPATPSTATLEVSVPDAQKLAVAADLGKLSLALRKTGSTEVAMTAPMHAANFVNGGRAPRPVRAFAPHRLVAPAGPPRPALIEVVASESKGGHAPRAPKKAPEPAPVPAPPAPPSTATIANSSRPS
jgi:pilus assembly protein CpaB